MPRTLFIPDDPPYGAERSDNALRLAGSLSCREGEELPMGDAASCAKKNWKPQGSYNTGVGFGNVGTEGNIRAIDVSNRRVQLDRF